MVWTYGLLPQPALGTWTMVSTDWLLPQRASGQGAMVRTDWRSETRLWLRPRRRGPPPEPSPQRRPGSLCRATTAVAAVLPTLGWKTREPQTAGRSEGCRRSPPRSLRLTRL